MASWCGLILLGVGRGLGRNSLSKIRLFVRFRKSNGGHFIASVPFRKLVKMSGYRKLKWTFEQVDDQCGWLILEAF